METKTIQAAWSIFKDDTLNFYITGFIWEWMFDDLVDAINIHQPKNLRLIMFSPGGSALTGLAIYDYLKTQVTIPVTADLFGYCASAATIIACGADRINISPNAYWMIHPANMGDVNLTEQEQNSVEDITQRMAMIYSKKSNQTIDWVLEKMQNGDQGELINAEDAVGFGFADSIIENTAAIAAHKFIFNSLNHKKMNPILKKLLAKFGIKSPEELTEDRFAAIEASLDQSGDSAELTEAIQNITSQLEELSTTVNQIGERVDGIETANASSDLTSRLDAITENITTLQATLPENGVNTVIEELQSSIAAITAASAVHEPTPPVPNKPPVKPLEGNNKKVVAKSDFMDAYYSNGNKLS